MSKRNKGKQVVKAADYKGTLADFKNDYNIYPELTKRLDEFKGEFDAHTINEIVLWKLGRYVKLPESLLGQLDQLRELKTKEHRKASALVGKLQQEKGVQLRVASTLLRFANPDVFQIIDSHAYRAVYGTSYTQDTKSFVAAQLTDLYFDYLDKLHELCEQKRFSFRDADRILFVFDKKENPPLNETE
jgi:thermostable 8-oxoguanine DNA glycosylase